MLDLLLNTFIVATMCYYTAAITGILIVAAVKKIERRYTRD